LANAGEDGNTMSKWTLKKLGVKVWIHVVQYKVQWWALVNTIMDLWVP